MPRPSTDKLGKRDTWAAHAGYNTARSSSHNGMSGAQKWSAGGIGNQHLMSDEEAAIRIAFQFKLRQAQQQEWKPLPIQICPKADDDTSWDTWILRGGRGSGKTEGASRYVLNHLRKYGAKARVGVGGKTIADARDTCAEGISGLITIAPHEFYYHRSLGEARHIKGGYVKFLGAEEEDRWNGPQWSLLWCDELGLWPKETYDMAQFGLRLGDFPRTIISTTPKTAKWVEEIEKLPTTVHTTGTIYENFYLSEFARRKIISKYEGTSLEKRELRGEWFYESPNALWKQEMFRHVEKLPALARIVIAIDPAVTSGETADDTGIVAAGIDSYNVESACGYVLRDRTVHLSPAGWAETAIALYDELQADLIVAEVNNGGDLVEANIRAVCRTLGRPNIPFKKIHASRGKMIRAQPIVSLYEQGRIYHYRGKLNITMDDVPVDAELFSLDPDQENSTEQEYAQTQSGLYLPTNSLVELETEMCSWDPTSYVSPNRMDAVVWSLTELMMGETAQPPARVRYYNPVRISSY